MEKELVALIDQKLKVMLDDVDGRVANEIRDEWKVFSPAPNCPNPAAILKNITKICYSGYQNREKVSGQALELLLKSYGRLLSKQLVDEVESIIDKNFPPDKYVGLALKTIDVYARSNGPKDRVDDGAVKRALGIIEVQSVNYSRQARYRLKLILVDNELQARVARGPILTRWLSFVGKNIILPSSKWVFGIVASLIVAFVANYLRKNG